MFSNAFREEILTTFDDVGLRGLLHAHPEEVSELSVSTSQILSDMDHPEDYQRELGSIEKENTRGKE